MDIKEKIDGEDKVVETIYGSVKLTGGTIYGGFSTTGNTVTLGGSIKILDTDKEGKILVGLKVANKTYVTIEALNEDAIIKAVVDAGYGATIKGGSTVAGNRTDDRGKRNHIDYSEARETLEDHETPKLKKRLFYLNPFVPDQ